MLAVKVKQEPKKEQGKGISTDSYDISVSVNAAHSPQIKRICRQAYEGKMPGQIADNKDRLNFSLTIYGLTLPQHVQKGLFPGLTETRANELELTEEQKTIEYLSFGDLMDKTTVKHLCAILKIWEERMPLIKNSDHARFFDQGSLRFAIPDHLQWFDSNGTPIQKTAEEIVREYARSGRPPRVTVRLTVGLNAEEDMINPHYVWGPSQILFT